MSTFVFPKPPAPSRPSRRSKIPSEQPVDALKTAIGEKNRGRHSETPLLLSNPSSGDSSSGDSTRLTMKTRVAVRDKSPHRFQVVPLRDIRPQPTRDTLPLSHVRNKHAYVSTRLMRPTLQNTDSRVPISASVSLPLDENTSASCAQTKTRIALAGKTRTLSEKDININIGIQHPEHSARPPVTKGFQDQPQSIIKRRVLSTIYSDTSQSSIDTPLIPARDPQPQSVDELERHVHKLPSVDSVPAPSEDQPRVRCRKRTNTLSSVPVDGKSDLRQTNDGQNSSQAPNSLDEQEQTKRQAIYTQSLYVPYNDRPAFFNNAADVSQGENAINPWPRYHSLHMDGRDSDGLLRDFGDSGFAKRTDAPAKDGLGFIDLNIGSCFPLSFRSSISSSSSQLSIPSIYSQECPTLRDSRALRISRSSESTWAGDSNEVVVHHPIILELIAEVEQAIVEWGFHSAF